MTALDLPGTLRRIRRTADLSQRELARACGVSASVVAKAETGERDLPVQLLGRLLAVAELRLAVVDASGSTVAPMQPGTVRDAAGRRFPAHLDTRHGDEDWWGGEHRPRLRPPRYTFDVDRRVRDWRRTGGAPVEHHAPEPGDSLAERAAARQRESARRDAQERERRFREGRIVPLPEPFTCTCPAGCEYDEVLNEDMSHAAGCVCLCDLD
jgi:transcriptional regulator with XRE-family HTH domain